MTNLLFDIKWENNEQLKDYSDPLAFMYSILVGFGVFLVLGVSALNIWRRKIPLKEFVNAIYISLPIGVIGASIFGKLGSMEHEWAQFYELFFFWKAGLSFFGAMLCGGTAAFLWFWHKSKITKVSVYVYADCIIPNLLLGQSIGRWGNLFNHEILGQDVKDINQINWLPDFIWHRLFYIMEPSTGEKMETIQFKEPLFLYESIATLTLWILINFVFANFAKWISKKPWNVDPVNFPCKANKKIKSVFESELKEYTTQIPVKYLMNDEGKVFLSQSWVWKKAYTLYEPKLSLVKSEQSKINNQKSIALKAREKYNNLVNKINQEIEKEKVNLKKGKITKQEFKLNKKQIKNNYSEDLRRLKLEKNEFISFIKRDSRGLYELNNPNNYKVTHCGTLTGIYIMGYTIIRFFLDPMRSSYELTIKNMEVLNYLFLTGFLILGLTIFICAQFIAPKKWREEGWLYEKSY